MAVVYYFDDSIHGHLAMKLLDNKNDGDCTYINFSDLENPKEPVVNGASAGTSKGLMNMIRGGNVRYFIGKTKNFTGRRPAAEFYITPDIINVNRIKKWCSDQQKNGGMEYSLLNNNCGQFVFRALQEGGFTLRPFRETEQTDGSITPWRVFQEIRKKADLLTRPLPGEPMDFSEEERRARISMERKLEQYRKDHILNTKR